MIDVGLGHSRPGRENGIALSRAAVLIGVDRAGDLPVLRDAARGARRMENWAQAQGIDHVEVFTDETGPVDVAEIKRAVRRIVDAGTTERLLVYFAGHGVNIRYSEYWLLTEAPRDTQAAVNVAGSVVLAQYSGIPYVVFVSDACRTAAEGIQAQFVMGSEIFPNDGVGDLQQPVDQFFACMLGRPAHEIPDPTTTANEYSALYTSALLDGLEGKPPAVLAWDEEARVRVGYMRPRPLKAFLQTEVARRLKDSALQTKVIQIPDAHIASDETAWVSRFERELDRAGEPPAPAAQPELAPPSTVDPGSGPPPSARRRINPALSNSEVAMASVRAGGSLLDSALSGDLNVVNGVLEQLEFDVKPAADLALSVRRTREPFGPGHHETGCGFKVRGAHIRDAFSKNVGIEFVGPNRDDVRVSSPQLGVSVLLVFDDGAGVVLPAIPDFLGALTVEDGELVDVAYEPSDNTYRWAEFARRADEVRALRAVASVAARNGIFRLEGKDTETIARRMQYAKGVDPALAIYAAYAYQDIGLTGRIKEMSGFMSRDLGAVLFDVALLARELDGQKVGDLPDVLSFFPLLSQGWAILAAHRVQLPAELEGIEAALRSSLWTTFEPVGVEQLRGALQMGAH
jgi:hypothetical protein